MSDRFAVDLKGPGRPIYRNDGEHIGSLPGDANAYWQTLRDVSGEQDVLHFTYGPESLRDQFLGALGPGAPPTTARVVVPGHPEFDGTARPRVVAALEYAEGRCRITARRDNLLVLDAHHRPVRREVGEPGLAEDMTFGPAHEDGDGLTFALVGMSGRAVACVRVEAQDTRSSGRRRDWPVRAILRTNTCDSGAVPLILGVVLASLALTWMGR